MPTRRPHAARPGSPAVAAAWPPSRRPERRAPPADRPAAAGAGGAPRRSARGARRAPGRCVPGPRRYAYPLARLPRTVCFDLDSAPPIPVISGAAVSHDDLILEASDGNRFAAFLARPEEPGETGVVILPDVRGLYRFYEELALRFAERGYAALAFDYFGRTAGAERRGDDFEYWPHVEAVTPEQIQLDVRAAVEHLRALGVEKVFTVGFCMG